MRTATTISPCGMRPKIIEPIERWISEALERPGLPSTEEVRDNLTLPLLNQIKIDAGATIYEIAKGRLGIDGSPMSVRSMPSDGHTAHGFISCSRIAARS